MAVLGAWVLGLNRYLSFSAIAENREVLRSFVAAHFLLSLAAYGLIYFVATVVLLPGAALLTILGGFLFGWHLAAAVTIFAATLGATLIFLVARSSIGDILVKRAGPRISKLARRFRRRCLQLSSLLAPRAPVSLFRSSISPRRCSTSGPALSFSPPSSA